MTLTVTPDELRKHFDALLEKVERGDELLVRSKIVPLKVPVELGFDRDRVKILGPIEGPILGLEIAPNGNRTIIGEHVGKGAILGPIEGPIIPENDWRCLADELGPEYK